MSKSAKLEDYHGHHLRTTITDSYNYNGPECGSKCMCLFI